MNEIGNANKTEWPANEEVLSVFGAILFLICAYAYAGIIFIGWQITFLIALALFSVSYYSVVEAIEAIKKDNKWLISLINVLAITIVIAFLVLAGIFTIIGLENTFAYPNVFIALLMPVVVGLSLAITQRAFLLLGDQNKNIPN